MKLLLQIEGVLLRGRTCVGEGYGHFTRLHGRIPDPHPVRDAAVLLAADVVVDESGVHHVALAHVVHVHHRILVLGDLVVQHSAAAEAVEHEAEVEGRGDVLGGEYVQVVGFLGVGGQQGAEVAEFGVGHLRVEVLHGPDVVAPGLQGVVEIHSFVALAVEEVVVLHR